MTIASNMRARATELRDDNRGAVMLTGLFMSFFLVGALWYVIGVGDAIIFRDRMQEASDASAFSSAAMLAKGMNFISACNIIMMLMVAIHIIFGVIQDATIVTCLAAGIGCISCALACPKIPGRVIKFHNVAKKVKRGLDTMAKVETAIAIGAPILATVRGYTIGSEYGNQGKLTGGVHVAALSPANFPGFVGGRGIFGGSQPKLGLPVTGEEYGELCKKVGENVVGMISYLVSGFGSLKKLQDLIDTFIGGFVGSAIKFRYCNSVGGGTDDPVFQATQRQMGRAQDELNNGTRQDAAAAEQARLDAQSSGTAQQSTSPNGVPGSTLASAGSGAGQASASGVNGWSPYFDPGFDKGWGDKGWLKVDPNAGNGKTAFHVWAMTLNPKYREMNEHNVSIAGSLHATQGRAVVATSDQGSPYFGYFTQAEFFYDCEEKWGDEDCNKDDNASFGLRWRARLRPLQLPNLLELATRFINNPLREVISDGMESILQGNPLGAALMRSAGGAIAIDAIGGVVDEYVTGPIQDWATGQIDGLGAGVIPDLSSYH
jgi:hypothetical protein